VGLLTTRQPITFGALAVSLCCRGLVFFFLLWGTPLPAQRFFREFVACLAIAAACSIGAFLLDTRRLFAVTHAIHGVSVVAIAQILGGASLATVLLVSIPFFVESALYLGVHGALGSSILVMALLAGGDLLRYGRTPRPDMLENLLAYIAVSAAGISALTIMVRNREWIVARDERIDALDSVVSSLSNANRAFQLYANSIEAQSAEDERKRITRELHDTVGYALTNIIMTVNAEKVLLGELPPDASELLDSMRRQAEETLEETRRILYRLRAANTTTPVGLSAIDHLVRTFQAATGVAVELRRGNYPDSCGSEIDAVVYRFIQEGLINAFRHGKATRVAVNLWQRARELSVSIWDNGVGSTTIDEGIGLKGMRERFASLGGHIDPHDTVDGFEVVAVIPIVKSVVDA
jgi:signal transduction histidine kinase